MNESLKHLQSLLNAHCECTAQELVEALYVLRAPRTLTAIIPMAMEFRDWRDKNSALKTFPGVEIHTDRLALLDQIAKLETEDEQLSGRVIARQKSVWTPLRPLTGDSVIGELLLIRAKFGQDSDAFQRLSVWLLWQAQRFHVQTTSLETYNRYLTPGTTRLLEMRHSHGTRLYNAFLAVRKLTTPAKVDKLRALNALNLELSDSRSLELTLFARMARLSEGTERRRLARYATERLGYEESALEQEVERIEGLLPTALSLLLTTIWGAELQLRAGIRRPSGGTRGRTVVRPEIRRGARLTEMLSRADEDEVHAGTIVDFFPRVDDSTYDHEDKDITDDDPDEEEQREPAFSLFLADRDDLINGYFAAKGMQNAIEYQNAQLRWAKCAISHEGIEAVFKLILGSPSSHKDDLGRRARLAIGLSLLTGRGMSELAAPVISASDVPVDEKSPLAISLREHRLYLRPAQPKLRKAPEFSPFCFPTTQSIELPLPENWKLLLEQIGPTQAKSPIKITRRAREQLKSLSDELKITEKGVRHAFIRALGECTGGDLGAQKVITDGAEANSQNIIHYASYDVAQIENWWRTAAETLVGSLPPKRSRHLPGMRVGALHAFNIDALAEYFAEIQKRIQTAESGEDWIRAYNLLTLYLSYWLGLGVAGRKTRRPVPRITLADGWALVADKSRADGSTDRVVPLTAGLQAQIEAYVGLASELSILAPDLDPIVTTERGAEIQLQYIHREQGAVPYQPKYQEHDEQLAALPANWGRKLARSASSLLPGRYRDAELGHWTRGRHAWDITSSFDSKSFRRRWIDQQEALEGALGFKPMTVGGYRANVRTPPRLPAKPAKRAMQKPQIPAAQDQMPLDLDIESLLRDASAAHFERLMDREHPCEPEIALELVRRAVASRDREPTDKQRQLAEVACEFIRKKRNIPIFAVRPRPMFSNKFVLDAGGLQTLAYLQTHMFDAFWQDIAYLPPKESANDDVTKRRTTRIELGRLVTIGIWRLGLTRWALIESWLRALHEDAPVLALGESRYMIFHVTSETTREPMRRTVFLDSFSAAYLTVERETIRHTLLPNLFQENPATKRSNRRASVEFAIDKYLRAIGAGERKITLSAMTGAAVQRLMCSSAPIIAAYSRGALFTEDLGDTELRRLAGLEPIRQTTRTFTNTLPAWKEIDVGEADVPADVALSGAPILRLLMQHTSADKSFWQRHIRELNPRSQSDQLLQNFALWLLSRSKPGETNTNFGAHEKRYFKNRLKIIAYAILGHAVSEPDWRVIDERILSSLAEITRDVFPDRLQHGAWFQFYHYLNDDDADHAGFEVKNLGPQPERAVSAKIMSAQELDNLLALIPSAKSGIGNAALRISARRHIDLMTTYGMRRSESAFLRTIDMQEDLMRVQAYGEHGLKTAWADRVLPVGFAEPETQAWLKKVRQDGQVRLIDPDADTEANPDNFYNAINLLIKEVSQDKSMGSHHLRHTLVSRLVLTLLRAPADLNQIYDDFPWVEELLISDKRLKALLGTEGDAGQGIRAVSALVGHSHPTTTIKHYCHVLCIALYAALRELDNLDISRSFERRIGSRASVQRWAQKARLAANKITEPNAQRRQANQVLRNRIERKCDDLGIERDERQRPPVEVIVEVVPTSGAADKISFDQLELIDRSLRDGHLLVEAPVANTSHMGFNQLASITTGKKGSHAARHPLKQLEKGLWLPPPLAAGTATRAAVTLCEWLDSLRCNHQEEFSWLLDKWLHASERERGRMRLDNQAEIDRARLLTDTNRVLIEIKEATISDRRKHSAAVSRVRMRIKCLNAQGQAITRDTTAVRWVMSHVAARWIQSHYG